MRRLRENYALAQYVHEIQVLWGPALYDDQKEAGLSDLDLLLKLLSSLTNLKIFVLVHHFSTCVLL